MFDRWNFVHEDGDLSFERSRDQVHQVTAGARDADLHASAIERGSLAPDEPAFLSTVDQTRLSLGTAGRHCDHDAAQRPEGPDSNHGLIQIGAVTGPTMELPSVALRSANLRIQGNGQGAVSTETYLAELPSLIDEIGAGTIGINVRPVPPAEVEAIWDVPDAPGVRIVVNPQAKRPIVEG